MYVIVAQHQDPDREPTVRLRESKAGSLFLLRAMAQQLIDDARQSDGEDFGLKALEGDLRSLTPGQIHDRIRERFGVRLWVVQAPGYAEIPGATA